MQVEHGMSDVGSDIDDKTEELPLSANNNDNKNGDNVGKWAFEGEMSRFRRIKNTEVKNMQSLTKDIFDLVTANSPLYTTAKTYFLDRIWQLSCLCKKFANITIITEPNRRLA